MGLGKIHKVSRASGCKLVLYPTVTEPFFTVYLFADASTTP
jgi:hypothetical protein